MDLKIIILAAIITIAFMYFIINKYTTSIEENLSGDKPRLLINLLEFFISEIQKSKILNLNFKDISKKDLYFKEVDNIKSIANSKKFEIMDGKISPNIQSEIIDIFKKYEELNNSFLVDSASLNEELKNKLAIEFNK